MKKKCIVLALAMVIAIIGAIVMPTVSLADNEVESVTSANIVPAKGSEDTPTTYNGGSSTPVSSSPAPTSGATTSTLPKSGLENMSIIAIVVIAMMGIGSFIRLKTLK